MTVAYQKILFLTTVFLHLLILVHTDRRSDRNPRHISSSSLSDALLSYQCRGLNNRICSGNGHCRNGKCHCNNGYSGTTCAVNEMQELPETTTAIQVVTEEVATDIVACGADDAITCNGHGTCEDGACMCDTLWSGFRCELSMRKGFCKTYQECAECTSILSATCPAKCVEQANFNLVFGFKSTPTFHRCRVKSSHNCTFYFQLQKEDSRKFKTIQVTTCLPTQPRGPEDLETPTDESPDDGQTPTEEPTDDKQNELGDKDKSKGGPDSGAPAMGSDVLVMVGILYMLYLQAEM